MLSRRKSLIATFSICALVGPLCSCSLLSPAPQQEDSKFDSIPLSIDVFAARGFLGGSDYERYYLQEDFVWRECGQVAKKPQKQLRPKIEGDEVFANDPSLKIKQRRVENLSLDYQRTLKRKTAEFLYSLVPDRPTEPAPGAFYSLSDPGLFELKIKFGTKKATLVTSVDALSESNTNSLDLAQQLFAAVRGVGPVICNSKTFFGISRYGDDQAAID